MPNFHLETKVALSKSIANRYLLVCAYTDEIIPKHIMDLAESKDVDDLYRILNQHKNGEKLFDIGEGGAVLRFFFPYLLRHKGEYELVLGSGLAKRPVEELARLSQQCGASFTFEKGRIYLESPGEFPERLKVKVDASSQFASGLILNSWGLSKDLSIELEGEMVSLPYWNMTLEVLKKSGLNFSFDSNQITITSQQKPKLDLKLFEADASSCFALAGVFGLLGELHILNFPTSSLQADMVFVNILKQLGFESNLQGESFRLSPPSGVLSGINFDLSSCPDLFPVLVSLLAFSTQESHLYGAEHLAIKESNRLQAVSSLLNLVGRKHELLKDGIRLLELKEPITPTKMQTTQFDVMGDHRIAFAAAVFIAQGYPLDLNEPEVVNKSFSSFWSKLREGGVDAVPDSWA